MNSTVRVDLPVIDAERPVSREYNDEDLRAKFGPVSGPGSRPTSRQGLRRLYLVAVFLERSRQAHVRPNIVCLHSAGLIAPAPPDNVNIHPTQFAHFR